MNLNNKDKIQLYDVLANERDKWRNKNLYYHQQIESLVTFFIPKNKSVLDIGCGTGELLAATQPSHGVGIDFSPEMIKVATNNFVEADDEQFSFVVETAENLSLKETFDFVILSDLLGDVSDTCQVFRNIRNVTDEDSRIIITYYNAIWEPVLSLAEKLGLKMPQNLQNWLAYGDIKNLLELNGFEVIKKGNQCVFPKKVPLLSTLLNKYIAKLPGLNLLGITNYIVARKVETPESQSDELGVSVIIPCRNEKGNILDAVLRTPEMGKRTEIIFVDGNSNDGTVEEIKRVIDLYKNRNIRLIHQVDENSLMGVKDGKMLKLGKGDAVRKGFAAATEEVLMILDADLTVPPEELPLFYQAIVEKHGDFVNGTRLVYPMEKQAMRFLNKLGNKFFSLVFSWILEQKIKDTLCGTKVLRKSDYNKIAENRSFFGDFDPFGDFDLLFGASKQNLKIIELPVHYKDRVYGDIKIERFKHGLILLKMSVFAMLKLKFRF